MLESCGGAYSKSRTWRALNLQVALIMSYSSYVQGYRTVGRGTLGRGTVGRERKTRVDSRSGDLHRVDSRSGDLPRVDSRSGALIACYWYAD